MEGLVPTYSINGDGNGAGGWGDAIGAFGGALIGSWFGNGFTGGWGGGFGSRGGADSGNASSTGPAVVVMGNDSKSSSAEMDALTAIQSGINGLGLAVVQGQGNASLAAAQGFANVVAAGAANTAGIQNAVTQGFAGLNTSIAAGDMGIQQTLCQGFGGLNTAVISNSKDNALLNCQSTNAITSAIENCCCTTKQTIMAEGQATRDLISRYAYDDLQTKLCDAKAENAALKSQAVLSASQTAQTAEISRAIQNQAAQFGNILSAYRAGRIDQRDTAATTATA